MPYPLAPRPQSCSPIPHLSGPIPALLYLFSHPCNHLPAPLSLQSLSLLLHPCSSIPVFLYTTCMPFSPAPLCQSSSPIPHLCSPIPPPLQLYAFSPIPATPLLLLRPCSLYPAPLSQPPIPAPLSLLPNYRCYPFPSPLYKHLRPCYSIPVSLSAPPSLLLIPVPYPCSGLSKVASCRRKLCLAFVYRLFFLSKISLDWPLALTTQLSTSKLSDNPACSHRCSGSSASPSLFLCPFISIPAP